MSSNNGNHNGRVHVPECPDTRIAPNSIEAEEALLGSILLGRQEALGWVNGLVEANDFFVVRHGWIFDAIQSLHAEHQALDYLTVVQRLQERGQLDEVGGPAYLTHLINNTPTTVHATSYARIVAEKALRRRVLDYAGRVAQLASDEAQDAPKLMQTIYQDMLTLDDLRATGGGLRPFQDVLGDLFEQVEARYADQGEIHGLTTGLADLDALLGGIESDEFVLIAARPAMGKSILLMNIAEHVAKAGGTVALFSLEMADVQLARRSVAGAGAVNSQKLRTGRMTEGEYTGVVAAFAALAEACGKTLHIDHRGGLTPEQVRAEALRLKALVGQVDAVLVDYAQLMKAGQGVGRYEQVTAISIAMKSLAREMHCPVIAAAQLSRAVEQRANKRPQLSDLRDSGQLEQDADIVLGLYRDEVYDELTDRPNTAEIHVLKARNGPTGRVDVYFKKDRMRFVPMTTRTLGELL